MAGCTRLIRVCSKFFVEMSFITHQFTLYIFIIFEPYQEGKPKWDGCRCDTPLCIHLQSIGSLQSDAKANVMMFRQTLAFTNICMVKKKGLTSHQVSTLHFPVPEDLPPFIALFDRLINLNTKRKPIRKAVLYRDTVSVDTGSKHFLVSVSVSKIHS